MISIFACAPNVRVTETYEMNQKKTTELVKGKGATAKIVKRIEYYLNGQIKSEAKITNGKHDGRYIAYHPNGVFFQKGQFKSGNEKGKWIFYNSNGQIDSLHTYKDGLLNGNTEYYVYGKCSKLIKVNCSFFCPLIHGPFKFHV